jgi:hypothetical protein
MFQRGLTVGSLIGLNASEEFSKPTLFYQDGILEIVACPILVTRPRLLDGF